MQRRTQISKREIIRSLMLSPCYLSLSLRQRARLVRRLSRKNS